ncbi:hypothetical protein LCGC14_1275140 [marine sediment metagenome]|uniref:Uncharacterized protein n=1 Tax=marine sediment metagenome TaxID=412755 RepID=A0A0F9NDM6_9ZZZZ
MKTSKNFFFLIFFFSIFILTPISLFSPYVSGAEGDPVVISDFLKVDLIKFNDATPGDTITGPSYIPGGRDLISFENKGILEGSYNSETNSFVVWAEVTFGFEVNAWTANLIEDIYPEIVPDSEGKTAHFHYRTWKHGQIWLIIDVFCEPWDLVWYTSAINEIYYFKYNEVDYGDVYNVNDHDGSIETKIWIDPGRKLSGETTIAGQTFTTPILEADILDVSIVDMRGGEVGSYNDRYTGIVDGEDEGGVEITTLEPWLYPVTTTKIVNWLNEQDLGWHTPEELTVATIQQGFIDLSFKGADIPGSQENEMTFNLPIHLQPEVTKTQQYIPYTYGRIKYYTCCGKLVTWPTVDDKVQRDLSVHVYNQFVHYDLEVKLDLFMNSEFTAELSESFLDDPNLIITDRMWDATVFGEEPKILLPPPDFPWWMWLLIFLIVAIGVYVGFKIFKVYMESKRKPAQIIVRR